MFYFLALLLLVIYVGTFFYIPHIRQSQSGGSIDYFTSNITKLRGMFDHQLGRKVKFGSWHSVSFQNMPLFNKEGIWTTLKSGYGEQRAAQLHPLTYMLPSELHKVMARPDGDSYILKKTNSWARKGLLIVDSRQEVATHSRDYDIAQLLIPNPHLMKGYKYDIRLYLLVHHKYGIMLYHDGYFYFSQNPYNSNSKDMFDRIGGIKISTDFFKQRQLPQTTIEYPMYKGLYPKIVKLLQDIFKVYPKPLLNATECNSKRTKIFGIDIDFFKVKGPDGKPELVPMLIEMNSNPNLTFSPGDWKTPIVNQMLTAVEEVDNGDIGKFTLIRDN